MDLPLHDRPVRGVGYAVAESTDDLVAILTRLTRDVDHFNSTLALRRQALKGASARHHAGGDQVDRQSERIKLELAELIVAMREALLQLSRLQRAGHDQAAQERRPS